MQSNLPFNSRAINRALRGVGYIRTHKDYCLGVYAVVSNLLTEGEEIIKIGRSRMVVGTLQVQSLDTGKWIINPAKVYKEV